MDDEDPDANPFAAAYEGVTYQDSSSDGFEGDVFDSGEPTDFELDEEAARLTRRLTFLTTVAEAWTIAASMAAPDAQADAAVEAERGAAGKSQRGDANEVGRGDANDAGCCDALRGWFRQAIENRCGLGRLLADVSQHRVSLPTGTHESLVEFDRRQMVKEFLLENTIKTGIACGAAAHWLQAALVNEAPSDDLADWEQAAVCVRRALNRRDAAQVRDRLPALFDALSRQPLLYIPIGRNGDPVQVAQARSLQHLLSRLAATLPRLGLLRETGRVLELARDMESDRPTGPGAVSEFDRLFTIAYQAMVESLIVAAEHWSESGQGNAQEGLIECLNQLTEHLLRLWLAHSAGLRLSALESLLDEGSWRETVAFVKEFGQDLFTPRFLNEGNLRAIIHQGTDAYLDGLRENPGEFDDLRLLEALDTGLSRKKTTRQLQRIVLGILENYPEYDDYNHTTTQSDRGELIYCLLDFLRLKASYERMAWKLKPVVLAHEVLVRYKQMEAAELWRRSVANQTAAAADDHLDRYNELVKQYGMRLPTVADRLAERFVGPLEVDRIGALIQPAMDELRLRQPTRTFEVLEQEINEFSQTPTGVGLDVPEWLVTLEDEVLRAQDQHQVEMSHRRGDDLPWSRPTLEEIQQQLQDWRSESATSG